MAVKSNKSNTNNNFDSNTGPYLKDYRNNHPNINPQPIISPQSDNFLSKLVRFISGAFLWIILILVIGFIIFFFIKCMSLGTCQYVFDQIGFQTKTGIATTSGVKGIFDRIGRIISTGGASEFTDVNFDEVESNIIRKLSLNQLQYSSFYYFNKIDSNISDSEKISPITGIRSSVQVQGIEKDTYVNVFCRLKDYPKDGLINYDSQDSLDSSQNGTFMIYGNYIGVYSIGCNFMNGINPGSADALYGSREVTLGIDYETTAESTWRPYILHSSVLRNMIQKGKDPAETMKKDPAYDSSRSLDGMATERSYESSEVLTIKSLDSMPFTEGKNYNLVVGLRNQESYSGDLKKLNQIMLTVPNNVELIESNSCNFYFMANDDDGNKVYGLKQSYLTNINNACSESLIKNTDYSLDECQKTLKNQIEASCSMRFEINEIKETSTFLRFKAIASYNYELERSAILTFRKQS